MWSLYLNENNEMRYLKPLVFSNGKSQEDVVKEVLEAINDGSRVIFIEGKCGTGKSALALNLAKEIGRASIIVPVKALQKQYEEDYTNKKFLLKNENKETDKQKLKIKVITGRINHLCPYLQKSGEFNLEENMKLSDFNKTANKDVQETKLKKDISCDNSQLPCKIEIKKQNIKKIREYIRKNPKVELKDFINAPLSRIRRMSIAPVCPYWSPIVPSEIELDLEDAKLKNYKGLKEIRYTIYQRKYGCGYYNQFNSYIDSDAIIFNSQKYKLETIMNRKPSTSIEIIDECDEFLDSFSDYEKINIDRLNLALGNLFAYEKTQEVISKLITLTKNILEDKKIKNWISKEEIILIKDTAVFSLLKYFLNSEFMDFVECNEENYCYHVDKVAKMFDGFFNETYVSFDEENEQLIVKLVTVNLEKRFKELLDKNKVVVMMSGTIHSARVLKDIFGLSDFKTIEAETKMPGKITKLRTGYEINCKYENFQKGKVTREQYLLALSKCIEKAKLPCLIHVNSFKDLPTEQEIEKYYLKNIMTQKKLKLLQKKDRTGEAIKQFKEGEIKILFSTKCNRGVDFPGPTCNSIILTKYPYPDTQDLFWKILKKTKPKHYNSFYIDKAKREFLQRIYRGLRSKEDKIFLLSPDVRVWSMI